MRAFERDRDSFELIETMRWRVDDGLWLLDYHLERLGSSARYFGFACDIDQVRAVLNGAIEPLDPARRWRVRLTLARGGTVAVTTSQLEDASPALGIPMVVISDHRTDSADVFLYHKTTNRRLYDSEFIRMRDNHGCAEVLFGNERGELTEGSRTNLFVQFDDVLHTPPIRCGLLDGTLRRSLLSEPHARVREAIVTPDDLKRADKLLIGNSVIGLLEVRLDETLPRQGLNRK
ncbi:MAG: aminotransferase class IV [Candidatus Binataceae bacterium]|jgi:para-aminobenzoate synthetase/4-amino-4-deoxychorismate lyase